ncbi:MULTISPECIES: VOC family protein [unclassified Streptomyces]|uniref:VOC family protein n=1 Tax=unclassified Streptomyces TaxID=2593676 RepID=UPI0036FBA256
MTDARGARPNGEAPARHTPGTPCRVSLMVHGLGTTEEFYGALFGWEFRPGPQQPGPSVRALLDGQEVAGIGSLPPERCPRPAWTPWFASDDVDLTAEAVRSCGGTIGVGPLDAAGAGRLAIGSDPGGAVFGICRASGPSGTGVTGAPGSPAWNELTTYESTHVTKFYAAVFGHETEPVASADLDHVTLHLNGRPVAGVRGVGNALPRNRGAHWMTYFTVTDTDEAVDRVVRLGGQVLEPARESDRGRAATVADPQGARFALLQGPR